MRFRGLDLNLLATFAALMEERSVSRAATRLNLSQPAVSAALARLRSYFGDELLVLEGRRMFPTALAETLLEPVVAVLRSIDGIVDSSATFDPASARRTFRIAASDYVMMVLIRPLAEQLGGEAPGLRLSLELPSERAALRLDEGKIDLMVIPEEFASQRHPLDLAFEDSHVVVGARDHPALAGPISREDFCALEHVAVMVGTDVPAAFADRQLEQLGVSRRVGVTVPSFAAVPWMLAGTERIGLMHARLATLMAASLPITTSPIPFDFPLMREVLQYHRARGGDPGLAWLRGQLLAVARREVG
ncbi:LysR family transcriptional regulator [Sphingomonas sp. BAUL-RG-20F-R05-02]|uniref:LysR family transcriptional regulator n=1 Tax=Sphingomonas sp. BAUL-RG-20F-R05-02 TaxID=2914830 RepID=UPI001F59D2BA|nr:LysR family transcriptional regulator [Sphingomonas sp. BAUL-RG-20F-R05-02]